MLNLCNGQTVTTDKVDYSPGDIVTASGTGWKPGEQVNLNLMEQVLDPSCPEVSSGIQVCDGSGKFVSRIYSVGQTDLGGFFHLTSSGRESGHISTITFNVDAAPTPAKKTIAGDEVSKKQIDFKVFPNPFAKVIVFEFTMAYSSHVRLDIYSVSGSLLKTIADENLNEGDHKSVEFNATEFPHSTFLYRFISDRGQLSGTIMKTK